MKLLVIDTQNAIMTNALYNFDTFVSRVTTLIQEARTNGIEVIYVRHDDGDDGDLIKGTSGFEIYDAFAPMKKERVFDKTVNSVFKNTGLLEYLRRVEERDIMIVGLQTDYCIDASVKCAFEHGFQVYIPAYTNTTIANTYMSAEDTYCYYNNHMWPKRYATCMTIEEALEKLRYIDPANII